MLFLKEIKFRRFSTYGTQLPVPYAFIVPALIHNSEAQMLHSSGVSTCRALRHTATLGHTCRGRVCNFY